MTYAEEVGLANAQHEYMANHLNDLVRGLKEFVAKNYPQTHSSILNNGYLDEPYIALCLGGLEGTKFYSRYLQSKNISEQNLAILRNEFVTGENPNCYDNE